MFDFRRLTLFCLSKRLSKHTMTIFSKHFGGPCPLWPPLAIPMRRDKSLRGTRKIPTMSQALSSDNTFASDRHQFRTWRRQTIFFLRALSKLVTPLFAKYDHFAVHCFVTTVLWSILHLLHLNKDWWCVGKRETSFPVNKLWLIYLPPSLWPLTMKNRYACKF